LASAVPILGLGHNGTCKSYLLLLAEFARLAKIWLLCHLDVRRVSKEFVGADALPHWIESMADFLETRPSQHGLKCRIWPLWANTVQSLRLYGICYGSKIMGIESPQNCERWGPAPWDENAPLSLSTRVNMPKFIVFAGGQTVRA